MEKGGDNVCEMNDQWLFIFACVLEMFFVDQMWGAKISLFGVIHAGGLEV